MHMSIVNKDIFFDWAYVNLPDATFGGPDAIDW